MRIIHVRAGRRSSFFLYLAFGVASLLYYTYHGLGNDFPIFFHAGQAVLRFQSPWQSSSDPVYAAYLNGPLTSIFLGFTALLPSKLGLFLIRALSITALPIVVRKMAKIFEVDLDESVWLVSILLLFSFPIRANLEYGQLFVIYCLVAVTAVQISLKKDKFYLLISSGILIGICLDYKPQSFVILLPFVFAKLYRIVGLLISIMVSAILSLFISDAWPFLEWLQALKSRSGASYKTSDQMSLLGISWQLGIVSGLAIAATCVLYFYGLLQLRDLLRSRNYLLYTTIIIFNLVGLSFFLHPTDLVLNVIALLFLLTNDDEFTGKPIIAILLGFSLIWSNSIVVSITQFFIIQILVTFLRVGSNHYQTILISSPALFFALACRFSSNVEMTLRHSLNFGSCLGAILMLGHYISNRNRAVEQI